VVKYKCVVELEPIMLEVESRNYTDASIDAIIRATERIKSIPFKLLAEKFKVKCYKME